VVRRERVVGVRDGDQVGHGRRRPDVLHVGRPAAGARREVGVGRLAVVEDDLVRRLAHGRVRARSLGFDPAVDLAASVRVEVEVAAFLQVGEGVGARDDRLRGERLRRPAARHLGGNDTQEVRLEPDHVHHLERGAGRLHAQRAAVAAAAERERRRARREEQRSGQRLRLPARERDLQPRAERLRPGRELVVRAVAVDDGERRRRGDDRAPGAREQEHPHLLHRRRAELRARVVVRDDLVERPAVQRVAVCAVLRQADAVAPAVAGDEQHRQRSLLRVRLLRGRVDDVWSRSARCEPECGDDCCCEFADHRPGPRACFRRDRPARPATARPLRVAHAPTGLSRSLQNPHFSTK